MNQRHPRTAAAALGGVALLALAACGSGASTTAHSTPSREASTPPVATAPAAAATAAASPTAGRSSAPVGSATALPPATVPASEPGTMAPIPTHLCLSGTVRVFYPSGSNPLRAVCVHAGTQITVSLSAAPNYKWSPVTSSTPTVVLMLANHAADGGSLVEIGRAQAPGTTTLSSTDSFVPDPHGPPSRLWQLNVQVVP